MQAQVAFISAPQGLARDKGNFLQPHGGLADAARLGDQARQERRFPCVVWKGFPAFQMQCAWRFEKAA